MLAKKEDVVVRLTQQQGKRVRRIGAKLWSSELGTGEICRLLLLEYLLVLEDERDLVGEEVLS